MSIDFATDYRTRFDCYPLLCPCVLCIDERLQVGSHQLHRTAVVCGGKHRRV